MFFSKFVFVVFWFFGMIVAVFTNFVPCVFLSFMITKVKHCFLKSFGKKNQQSKTIKQEHPQRVLFFEFGTQNKIFFTFFKFCFCFLGNQDLFDWGASKRIEIILVNKTNPISSFLWLQVSY